MSFYRNILAAVAAVALVSPVFADDTSTTMSNDANTAASSTMSNDASATKQMGDMSTQSDTKINLNKASAKELMKVKGISASKARAIVAYRKKHGNFTSTDDLMKVKGFKKMKSDNMKEIQDQVSAN